MIDDIKKDAAARMAKSVEALAHELAKIRTGRAHPTLLDHVMVTYYGSDMPIRQVANVTAEDARTLAVHALGEGMVQAVEKAIMQSDLGLNPNTAGTVDPGAHAAADRGAAPRPDQGRAPRGRAGARGRAQHPPRRQRRLKDAGEGEDDLRGRRAARPGGVQKLTDQYVKEVDEVLAARKPT